MQTREQIMARYQAARARLYAGQPPKIVEPPRKVAHVGPVVRDVLHLSSQAINTPMSLDRVKKIVKEVCNRHGLEREELISDRRSKFIVVARHELCWRLAKETSWSLAHIGRYIGRDHTSVLHAVRTYQRFLEGKQS